MPNLPISQLPELTTITSNDEFPVVQGGTTYKVKRAYIASGKPYISAYQKTTQSGFTANVAYSVSASTVSSSYGISVVDGSKFTVSSAGTYNLQFSLQLNKLQGGGKEEIDIWLSKNGNNVDWSNTTLTLANNSNLLVAAWNFVEPLNAGEWLELKIRVTSTYIVIQYNPGHLVPLIPDTPSSIITMVQI